MANQFRYDVCNDRGKPIATFYNESEAYEYAQLKNRIVFDHQLFVYTDPFGMVIRRYSARLVANRVQC